jgi:hypothetical protein
MASPEVRVARILAAIEAHTASPLRRLLRHLWLHAPRQHLPTAHRG